MRTFLIIGFIMLLLHSCMKMIFIYHGVKNPNLESAESLREFMLKKGMDTSLVYRVQDPYIFRSWEMVANKSFIYNRDGIRIMHDAAIAENERCSKNALGFLQTYKSGDVPMLDSSHTFDMEIQRWHTLAGTSLHGVPAKGKDLTIIYYWNCFSGTPNHQNYFKEAHKIIAERSDLDIVFYKVNQDLREGMDIETYTRQHQLYKDSLKNAQSGK